MKRAFKYLWLPMCASCVIVVVDVILFTKWGERLNVVFGGWEDALRITLWVVSFIPPLYSLYRAEARCAMSEALAKSKNLLEAAAKRLFQEEDLKNVRANFMLVEGKGSERKLWIFASWNMDLWPDKDIRLLYGQGCAGVAWKRACEKGVREQWLPVVALPGLYGEDLYKKWRLSGEQIEKTRHVSWILSVPVFIKDGNGHPQLIGVLNFDGIQNLSKSEYLKMEQTHKDAADVAEAFGREIKEYLPHVDDLCAR